MTRCYAEIWTYNLPDDKRVRNVFAMVAVKQNWILLIYLLKGMYNFDSCFALRIIVKNLPKTFIKLFCTKINYDQYFLRSLATDKKIFLLYIILTICFTSSPRKITTKEIFTSLKSITTFNQQFLRSLATPLAPNFRDLKLYT